MRIKTYTTMLNEERHNVLHVEESFNYPKMNDIRSMDKVVTMMNDVFNIDKKAEEYVYLIAVDTKTHVNGVFEISHGAVNKSVVGIREIFIHLLLAGATGAILVHNHPSGDTEPSREDILLTKRLKEACQIMGYSFLDHIIIGEDYFSFKKEDML